MPVTWRDGPLCADISSGVFRALTYEFKNHQATEGTDDQCLAQLMQGT